MSAFRSSCLIWSSSSTTAGYSMGRRAKLGRSACKCYKSTIAWPSSFISIFTSSRRVQRPCDPYAYSRCCMQASNLSLYHHCSIVQRTLSVIWRPCKVNNSNLLQSSLFFFLYVSCQIINTTLSFLSFSSSIIFERIIYIYCELLN